VQHNPFGSSGIKGEVEVVDGNLAVLPYEQAVPGHAAGLNEHILDRPDSNSDA